MENFRIETVEDVKEFFEVLHNKYKLAFHPDDPFEDYVSIESGTPTFTSDEAKDFNALMNQCFEVCERNDVEIYSVGLSLINPETL